jgi:uncharacterized membrane protein YbhN (UPF0104 family)
MKNVVLNNKEPKQEKINLRKIISWTLTILVVALMGWYLWKNQDIFINLKRLQIQDVILIALLQPINIIIGAVINKLIIDQIDQHIPVIDAVMLQFTNNFLNRFISEGGAVYRGAYLKAQYAFPISKFLASLGGVYIISLMSNALLGLIFSIFMYLELEIFNIYLLIAFGAILLGCSFLIVINPSIKSEKWIFRKINQVVLGWNSIRSNRPLVMKIFFLTALALLNSSIIVYIVYHGLGWELKIFNSLFYSTISSIANVINLTPGGLGINEAILMFSAEVIGLPSDIILLGSLLLRAISMLTTLSLGGLSYLILNIRLQKPADRD